MPSLRKQIETAMSNILSARNMDYVNAAFRLVANANGVEFIHYTAQFSSLMFRPNSLVISTLNAEARDKAGKIIDGLGFLGIDNGTPILMQEENEPLFTHALPHDQEQRINQVPIQVLFPISDITQGRGYLLIGFCQQKNMLEKIAMLFLFSKVMHATVAQLHCVNPSVDLKPEETICLEYAAFGKSSEETSLITGMSKRTIDYHITEAMKKLNTTKRISAVVKGLLNGNIRADI